MTLVDTPIDDFIERQEARIQREIVKWDDFRRENDEGVYLAFSEQRREGQVHVKDNELESERADSVREYLTLPDVEKVDGVHVDLTALQIPYNCMHKSCKQTGKYCCKITSCTANTDESKEVMQEAGRHFIDKFSDEERKEAIRRGNTHTEKLQHNRRIDGHCVFGEMEDDVNPDTGDEHSHIHCNLHEGAYENDIPLHYLHSIGPSLFPADILIVDGEWFITAAHRRAKERRVTRWWVTSDDTICTNHGDSSSMGILQHPDFDSMYADILGRTTLDRIQATAYNEAGAKEPEIQDGWIHADERGLESYTEECRSCDGDGCGKCDGRGYFTNWRNPA